MKISKTDLPARDSAIKGLHYVAEVVKNSIGPFGQTIQVVKNKPEPVRNRLTDMEKEEADKLINEGKIVVV